MIILNDESRPLKSPTSPTSHQVSRFPNEYPVGQEAPPPYVPRPEPPRVGPIYGSTAPFIEQRAQPLNTRAIRKRQTRKRLRIVAAFGLTCFVFAFILGIKLENWYLKHENGGKRRIIRSGPPTDLPLSDLDHLRAEHCTHNASWDTLPNDSHPLFRSASAALSIPAVSSSIFFYTKGNSIKNASVVFSDSSPNEDSVRVFADIRHPESTNVHDIIICYMSLKDGSNGIGIFVPDEHVEDDLEFDLSVHIPFRDSLPHYNLRASLPRFSHDFETRSEFDVLSVNTWRGIIAADLPIQGNVVSLRTTEMPVFGQFKIKSSLDLSTTDSQMKVSILAESRDSHNVTSVTLKNKGGDIDAELALTSISSSPLISGNFYINTITSNSNLNLAITRLSPNSNLILNSDTSGYSSSVQLPSAYEGKFHLHTLSDSPYYPAQQPQVIALHFQDPLNLKRKRKYWVDKSQSTPSSKVGAVWWSLPSEVSGPNTRTMTSSINVTSLSANLLFV